MIRTTCRDCIFNIKQDGKQIGCQFDRLNKFTEKEWCEEDQCWIIDRLCTRCRNVNKYKDPIKEVIEESRVKVDVVILLNNIDDDIDSLIEQLRFFNVNSIKIASNLTDNHSELLSYCNSKNITLVRGFSTREDLIDDIVKTCKGTFYVILQPDADPDNFVEIINDLVEEQCKPLSMIEMEGGIVFNKVLHNLLNGNVEKSLQEKIKEMYNESNLSNL